MSTLTKHIKSFLLGIIILFMIIPFLQQTIKFIDVKPLNGSIEEIADSTWNVESWLNENYQKQKESYLNQHFGFRNWFVRLNNEIAFRFFNSAKANGVIIGKDNYLYEENYIKAYFGNDYVGKDRIRDQLNKLEKIQDTLRMQNKDVLIILAPGKATYYPEYIPDRLISEKKQTNYQTYLQELQNREINYLDFNFWFMEMKSSTKYPLYGKCGIHWSKYGEYLAADSIINYIGHLRKMNIPKLVLDSIIVKQKNEQGDYDIGEGMNLLFELPTYPMAYPSFHLNKNLDTQQPKVLFIADSYYWGMFNYGFSRDIFNNSQFWFYNQQIYPESFEKSLTVSDINIKKEVEKNDVIVLMSTDANLSRFPFGFIDQLYDSYFSKNITPVSNNEQCIQSYIHSIKESPEWLDKIKLNAQKEGISLEKALRDNAEYMLWQESKNKTK